MNGNPNHIVIVLGMHRSGTSVITRALTVLGVPLGDHLHPAGKDNIKGFFEDEACIQINEGLLAHLGSAYDQLDLTCALTDKDLVVSDLRIRAIELLKDRLADTQGLWGFKDPRTCRLLPFWISALKAIDCKTSFVLAIRNPLSVVRSLERRNNIAIEKGYLLWLQHIVPTVLTVAAAPSRVVIDYDSIVDSPFSQLSRIAGALGLSLPVSEAAVREFCDGFLEERLRHSRFSPVDLALDRRAPAIVAPLYDVLAQVATDRQSLDAAEVLHQFNNAAAFLENLVPACRYVSRLEKERQEIHESATAQTATNLEKIHCAADALAELTLQRERTEQVERELAAQHGLAAAAQQDAEIQRGLTDVAYRGLEQQREWIRDLERQLEPARLAAEERARELAAHQVDLAAAQQEAEVQRGRGDVAQQELAQFRERASDLERQLGAAQQDAETQRGRADVAQQELGQFRERASDLERQLEAAQQDAETQRGRADVAQQELGQFRERASDLERQLEAAKQDAETQRGRAVVAQQELGQFREQASDLERQLEAAKQDAETQRGRAVVAQQELGQFREQASDLERQLEAAKQDAETQRGRADVAQRRLEQLREWANDLEDQLEAAQREARDGRRQLAAYLEKLEVAREQAEIQDDKTASLERLIESERQRASDSTKLVSSLEIRRRAEIEGLTRELDAMRSLAESAWRDADAEHAAHQALMAELQEVLERMRTLESSTTWRATAPLRHALNAQPRVRRWLVRFGKVMWWSVSLQLPRRLTLWRAHRRRVAAGLMRDSGIAGLNVRPEFDGTTEQFVVEPRHVGVSASYFEQLGLSRDVALRWMHCLQHGMPQRALLREMTLLGESQRTNAYFQGLLETVRSSRFFDPAYYRSRAGFAVRESDLALHYLLVGEPKGLSPSAALHSRYYNQRYADISGRALNSLIHYTTHGENEGRLAVPCARPARVTGVSDPARENVIVVVHEASRTGAPILGWNIAEYLARSYNVYTVHLGDGPLIPAFEGVSVEIHGPFDGPRRNSTDIEFGLETLFAGRAFKYAIVNSFESRQVIEVLARQLIPSVLLIHEFISYAQPFDEMRKILEAATEIVFPAPVVMRAALAVHPNLKDRSLHIEPQGMSALPPGDVALIAPVAEPMQVILQAHRDGALIVLGAGTVCLRKGVDLFLAVAAHLRQWKLQRPVHFVWVGGGYHPDKPNLDQGYSLYLREQLERAGIQDDVTFLDEVSDLEPIYRLAGVLLLTSRLDPLPNVSIDAAHRGIPLVCFKNASGTADILLGNPETARGVVEYLNVAEAASVIRLLAKDEAVRARMAEATTELADNVFNMKYYLRRLDELGSAARFGLEHTASVRTPTQSRQSF